MNIVSDFKIVACPETIMLRAKSTSTTQLRPLLKNLHSTVSVISQGHRSMFRQNGAQSCQTNQHERLLAWPDSVNFCLTVQGLVKETHMKKRSSLRFVNGIPTEYFCEFICMTISATFLIHTQNCQGFAKSSVLRGGSSMFIV